MPPMPRAGATSAATGSGSLGADMTRSRLKPLLQGNGGRLGQRLEAGEDVGVEGVPVDRVEAVEAGGGVLQDPALDFAARERPGIGDAHEADHAVVRDEAVRVALLQLQLQRALQAVVL